VPTPETIALTGAYGVHETFLVDGADGTDLFGAADCLHVLGVREEVDIGPRTACGVVTPGEGFGKFRRCLQKCLIHGSPACTCIPAGSTVHKRPAVGAAIVASAIICPAVLAVATIGLVVVDVTVALMIIGAIGGEA
jgi:hypothetical protein